MHQSLKYYRVQAFIRTASFKVRTSPQIEDRSYVGNRRGRLVCDDQKQPAAMRGGLMRDELQLQDAEYRCDS